MATISVIIPSNHSHDDLLKVVRSICAQSVKPSEIIIVDSGGESKQCPEILKTICNRSNIKIKYEYREFAMPGDARNIGLNIANCELIAFIDVQTIPRPNWLEASLIILARGGAVGVWGSTCFVAETSFERLMRDAFYGVLPRKTLPGSIFRCEVFNKSGQFISWVRAGEDTEWILRLKLLDLPIDQSNIALVDYVGLIGAERTKMLKKWYRSYSSARNLPHFFSQRLLLWVVLYPLIIMIAFNWNYLIADWRMDSPLYIGHITKLVAIIPCLIYVLLRGFLLPFRRGVGISQLLPTRFIAITLICIVGDSIKLLLISVYSPSRGKIFNKKNKVL